MPPSLPSPAWAFSLLVLGCSSSPAGTATPVDASTGTQAPDGTADGSWPDPGVPEDALPDDSSDGALPDGASAAAADAGPTVSGTVTVDRLTRLATLQPAYVGLSYEKGHLPGGFFSASNAALVGMLDLLGPGVLRVGGNTVDETEWQPAIDAGGPQPDAGITGLITPAEVDGLAAFAKAARWSVIYGLNMKRSTPDRAALEAAYASSALGAQLYGFEIGNEPDLYPSTLLSSTWSYPTFKTQWASFAAKIRASVPGAVFTGPATAYNYKAYTVPFAADEASGIALLTQHYYRANGQQPTSTLSLLLQPDPALATELEALEAAAKTNAIPSGYRMAECNSFYNGGAPNVSDAYGTALWVIDYLFTTASNGASGVNFHGGGNGPGYTPIADASGAVVGARPEFYGMLLFTKAGTGPILLTKASTGGLNFTAYAVGQADGSTRVVLVNKDTASAVHATVDVGTPITSADVLRLEGPGLDATTGMTLGGSAIDPTGAWTPGPKSTLPTNGTTLAVDVPPASAALVDAK